MSLMKKCKRLVKKCSKCVALQIGRLIAKKYERQENHYYFIKQYHLGDHVRTLPAISMFKQYLLSQGKPVEKIIVITKPNYSDLTRMNKNVDNVVVLNKYILMFLTFAVLNRNKPYNNIFVDIKGYYTIEQKMNYYNIPSEFICDNFEYSLIPNYLNDISYKKTDDFLDSLGVEYEDIVIIVPNAGSSSSIPYENLENVVSYFNKIGKKVFTNCGYGEDSLPNTMPLAAPADIIFSLVQKGATIIGVQCGLMDVCEWMKFPSKRIKIFVLKSQLDYSYFHNRKHDLNNKVEIRDTGFTIALQEQDDYKGLGNMIISHYLYYHKGEIQNKIAKNIITLQFSYNELLCLFNSISNVLGNVIIISANNIRNCNSFQSQSEDTAFESIFHLHEYDSYVACYDSDKQELVESGSIGIKSSSLQIVINDYDDYATRWKNHYGIKVNEILPSKSQVSLFCMTIREYAHSYIAINGVNYTMSTSGINMIVYSKETASVTKRIFSLLE